MFRRTLPLIIGFRSPFLTLFSVLGATSCEFPPLLEKFASGLVPIGLCFHLCLPRSFLSLVVLFIGHWTHYRFRHPFAPVGP